MKQQIDQIIKRFQEIKSLGFVASTRPNNRDGGIGNTLEDLLGIAENNLKEADINGVEVKSQRQLTNSKISLFSKAPTSPTGANAVLKDMFGQMRDGSGHKKLYASVFGNRESLVYGKNRMSLVVDRGQEIIRLRVVHEDGGVYEDVFWSFQELVTASNKLQIIMFVSAKSRREQEVLYYYFQRATLFYRFNFESFIKAIEDGDIQFDIRIGSYKSGKNIGKVHDHGSGFRVNSNKLHLLFESMEEVE
ncbi:TVG1488832 protein [Mucinivorans hirudinis]|uniref:TVG1488832 protein n=1 Tax=Mucinivorans hirudinis TaxID=1433126 RepID=A0A060R8U9_9BACT|nr:TVG1488832 protein [Mucinivorans hirudinis]